MIRYLLLMASILFAGYTHAESVDVCAANESQFVDMVGGAAIGSTITANVAGESVLLVIAQGGVLVATAPAVATGVTATAVAASAAYVSMKAYCNADAIGTASAAVYETSVDNTSRSIEIVIEKKEETQGGFSDMFCGLFDDCAEYND